MAEGFSTEVVKCFTGEIASRVRKASTLAATAQTLNSQGPSEHAFDTLMDIEPLIFEATALLNAASIMNRREDVKQNSSYLSRTFDCCLIAHAASCGRGSGPCNPSEIPPG
jgi:hypothetical protein